MHPVEYSIVTYVDYTHLIQSKLRLCYQKIRLVCSLHVFCVRLAVTVVSAVEQV